MLSAKHLAEVLPACPLALCLQSCSETDLGFMFLLRVAHGQRPVAEGVAGGQALQERQGAGRGLLRLERNKQVGLGGVRDVRGLGLEARERGHDPVGADADGRAAVAEEEVPRGAGVRGPAEHAARRRGAAPARRVAGPAGLPAPGLSGAGQEHGRRLGGGARVPGPAAMVPPSPGGQRGRGRRKKQILVEAAETGASEAGRRGGGRNGLLALCCWLATFTEASFACYRGLLCTLRTVLLIGSNHLISQTGWNRCNLSLSLDGLLLLAHLGPNRTGPTRTGPCYEQVQGPRSRKEGEEKWKFFFSYLLRVEQFIIYTSGWHYVCVCVHACFRIVLHVFGISGISPLEHMLAYLSLCWPGFAENHCFLDLDFVHVSLDS